MQDTPTRSLHWDIFCTVVDNYGDIGVCWRLARQLVTELGQQVHLWVDDLASFQRLCPEIDTRLAEQQVAGIAIHHWGQPFVMQEHSLTCTDVVIEAFACELPHVWLEAMARRTPPPLWINLEYLSAEAWTRECHGLPSRHPQLPLTKHFFFPGFHAQTGGLLRERQLIETRRHWQGHPRLAQRHFQLPTEDGLVIALFCYHNPALPDLLASWIDERKAVHCLLPIGPASRQIEHLPDWPDQLQLAQIVRRGSLSLHVLPFVPQQDFDLMLWSSDLNFVRGEDSLVRALWAARPLVWQAYPQQDQAHLDKLAAFLRCYAPDAPELRDIQQNFWLAWNRGDGASCAALWPAFRQALPALRRHAIAWSEEHQQQTDLARQLSSFCAKRV